MRLNRNHEPGGTGPDGPVPPPPHCNGRHGITDGKGDRCEWCDALTDAITLVRALERRVLEQDRRISALEEHVAVLEARS